MDTINAIFIGRMPSKTLGDDTGSNDTLVINNEAIPATDALGTMYQLLDVQLVQPLDVTLKGHAVTIWCDEEFLLKVEPGGVYDATTVTDDNGFTHQLLGRILLTGDVDEEGNNLSCPLDIADIAELFNNNQLQTGIVRGKAA